MIGVAQGLGLSVVAEGVETEGQRDALLEAGCSLMQGFLFAEPHPAAEVDQYLRGCQPVKTDLVCLSAATTNAATTATAAAIEGLDVEFVSV